jgi:hypothetical protein
MTMSKLLRIKNPLKLDMVIHIAQHGPYVQILMKMTISKCQSTVYKPIWEPMIKLGIEFPFFFIIIRKQCIEYNCLTKDKR